MKDILYNIRRYFNKTSNDTLPKKVIKNLRNTKNIDDFFLEEKDGSSFIPIPLELDRSTNGVIYDWYNAIIYTKLVKDFQEINV